MSYTAYPSLILLECCLTFWLALGAEIGAAVTDNNPLNRGAASLAEFAPQPVGDPKLKVSRAQLPTGAKVGIHAGSLITNG